MQEHYNDMVQASNNFDDKDFETMSAKVGLTVGKGKDADTISAKGSDAYRGVLPDSQLQRLKLIEMQN